MKKLLMALLITVLIGSFLTLGATAAEKGEQAQMHNAFRMSQLMNKTALNQQGQDLGTIQDVVVDRQGRTAYFILSGDKLGKANELIPIPIKAASPEMRNNNLIFNLSQQQLKNAPGFQKDNWSQFSQMEQRVNAYYQSAEMGGQQGTMAPYQGKQGQTTTK